MDSEPPCRVRTLVGCARIPMLAWYWECFCCALVALVRCRARKRPPNKLRREDHSALMEVELSPRCSSDLVVPKLPYIRTQCPQRNVGAPFSFLSNPALRRLLYGMHCSQLPGGAEDAHKAKNLGGYLLAACVWGCACVFLCSELQRILRC